MAALIGLSIIALVTGALYLIEWAIRPLSDGIATHFNRRLR